MTTAGPATAETWAQANHRHLQGELERLRLLLKRRALWLRQQWQKDALKSYQVISDAQADWLLNNESRQAEWRFYRENSDALSITRSIAEREGELAEAMPAFVAMGNPPALEALVHLFGLSSFERSTLLLCLAPELDSSFERLYAYAQDDLGRKHATPHLALMLLSREDEGWSASREVFLPESPLRRFRLVTVGAGTSSTAVTAASPLGLNERIVSYLLGVNQLDHSLCGLLEAVQAGPLSAAQDDLAGRLQDWFRSDLTKGPWPVVNLIGGPGVGKGGVARSLCKRLGLQLYRLEPRALPLPEVERQAALRVIERESVMLQFAVYVDAASSDYATEPHAREALRSVVEGLNIFFILGTRERWQTERNGIGVVVAKPDLTAQRSLWQQALAGARHSLNGGLESLLQQFDFGPLTITRAVAAAVGEARLRAPNREGALTLDDLWQACREQVGSRLEELAQRIVPCYAWDDIVLSTDLHQQLQEIAGQVAHRQLVYEAWGFGAKLARGRGISALFCGPSGTGKTMAAEVLARHLQLELYRIDLSGVVSKYIGETEKNVRKVFDVAEQSGAILFFDEADALFGKRSEVKDSHDRYANIEISYLLQRMEDYRGLAILATNMRSHLDQAFLRRLRFQLDFPLPDGPLRLKIWQKAFPPKAVLEGLDFSWLSRLEIPGGNIRNIALNAAFLAAAGGATIQMTHVLNATCREYAKIDKLLLPSDLGPYWELVRR